MIMKKLRVTKGPIVRNRKIQREYNKYRNVKPSDKCQFCTIVDEAQEEKLIQEFPLFWVITAKFPYHVWDGARTSQHLLAVPKRHVHSITEFNLAEQLEFVRVIAEYEGKGYSFYGRAAQNKHKSVPHQHTHLIEIGKEIKSQLYLQRPFINIAR